ncbi:MAG: GGDEF domain-containing protein [Lachnospiraceae bacterium]|nr:GGDEF domain-containing protein [Lachnospiraceae bacterium]
MLALVKASVACYLFTIYMVSFYYRKPHIPVKSTKIFQCLTIVALINSSFDLITLCTVNHMDVVPEFVNLVVHIVYLMSILGFVFLLYLYMRSYLETTLKFSKWTKILHSLPLVLSTVGIFVLPITYVQGKTTAYSLGGKAYALYGSLVVYLVLILYYCLRYWKLLDGEKRVAIILAVPLFVATALIQMMIPETLLVVVCSTLILLGLILSNENVEKYLDEKTALFNQYAFETVLDDYDFEKQKIVAAVLCFCKTESRMDWKQDVLILNDIYKELKQYRLYGYRAGENGVVFIGSAKERLAVILEKIKQKIENTYGSENISIETKLLAGNDVDTKYSCMRNIISFCTESGSRLAYIDYLTNIYNRNALERDLAKQQEKKTVSYLLADLNGLKIVNDTIGHSAGDKLLQDFAVMLMGAVGDEGRVYRQGGDEFAVLYEKDAQIFIRNLEKRCGDYNKACAVPISYAIGYSLLENENFRNDADQMMYADKRRKKGIM